MRTLAVSRKIQELIPSLHQRQEPRPPVKQQVRGVRDIGEGGTAVAAANKTVRNLPAEPCCHHYARSAVAPRVMNTVERAKMGQVIERVADVAEPGVRDAAIAKDGENPAKVL